MSFQLFKSFHLEKKAKNWRKRLERGRCETFTRNSLCAEIEHKTFHSIHFHPFALTRKQNFLIFRHCVGILMEILFEKRFSRFRNRCWCNIPFLLWGQFDAFLLNLFFCSHLLSHIQSRQYFMTILLFTVQKGKITVPFRRLINHILCK